jgi:hypothetical protein
MPRILLIPLDDRPCCLQFVERLAEMAEVTLITPPLELLGRFLQPGNPAGLRGWYAEHAPGCDLAIVSLDMLTFGGLVASRNLSTSLDSALLELDAFFALDGPPVLAFQSIMRTAPTQSSDDDVRWASTILELSQAVDPERIERLSKSLPPERLAAYRRARERNHQLNRTALERVGGKLSGLLLGIDDSKTRGWNIDEIRALEPLLGGRSAWITPGTDESAHLLLARAAARQRDLQVVWSQPAVAEVVGAYEDRSMGQLLTAQMAAADLRVLSSSTRQLLVYGVHGPQREAAEQQSTTVDPIWVEQIAGSLQPVIADVRYANGGDLSLLTALQPGHLQGYAAWNTAGNTIGTALATAALGKDDHASRRFTAERLGDDGLYQGLHRQLLRKRLNHPGLTLSTEELKQANAYLNGHFLEEWKARIAQLGVRVDSATLPWGRLFEAQVTAS